MPCLLLFCLFNGVQYVHFCLHYRYAYLSVFFSRPLAYSTLADLVHHVRQNLPLTDLSLAVQLFAKNIDDESLPSNIQTMSCKLLLNLVDCIRSKSEQENGNGRDILMRMLEVGSIIIIEVDVNMYRY